jgi:hypothetical protein
MIFHNISTTKATEPPPNATPTDELARSNEEIRVTKPAARTQSRKRRELETPWYRRSPKHLSHILGDIEITEEGIIQKHLRSTEPHIMAASDGGHDPASGISTFGWTVATNKVIIARGRGPAQAHPDLAESFRSEGYGLTSVTLFLRNLIERFSLDPAKCRWTIYIDNKSLIQRIRSFEEHTPVSRWNLRPDEDIARTAYEMLSHIPATLEHIKSHQDQNNKGKTLPFKAVLNIAADTEATRQRNKMDEPDRKVQYIGMAQLQINGITITRDSYRWIMRTAGSIPIQQYYQEKHGWNENIFQNISWDSQAAVLRTYPQEDQTRIIKFVHGWLPTQNRKLKEGKARNQQCQLCKSPVEDNIHLFACDHKQMKHHQEQLAASIRKWILDHGSSELSNLMEISITESCTEKPWKPNLKFISSTWIDGMQDQTNIGWQHIYSG